MYNEGYVEVKEVMFGEGIGEQFKPQSKSKFNPSLFDSNELKALREVATKFKDIKTADVIALSHKEKAWLENEKKKELISYRYAFDLTQIQ